jgi:hypothetical protein
VLEPGIRHGGSLKIQVPESVKTGDMPEPFVIDRGVTEPQIGDALECEEVF